MKKSISKKMFALSVLMSAGILMTGCSGTAAEPQESTPAGSSTEAMQGVPGVQERRNLEQTISARSCPISWSLMRR